MEITEATTFEEKTIKDLYTLDPFLHMVCNSKHLISSTLFPIVHKSVSLNLSLSFLAIAMQSTVWRCTVTVTQVQEGNTWWFASCNNCGKSCPQVICIPVLQMWLHKDKFQVPFEHSTRCSAYVLYSFHLSQYSILE
jgi:hypothetical protein